jgi:hypothetical protein
MVYLTVILPPVDKASFFSLVNVWREDIIIIRDKIIYRNIAYSVRSVTTITAEEAIAVVIK